MSINQLLGSKFNQNLNLQISQIERDFKETISRLKGVDEYIASRLKRAKRLIGTMPNNPDWIEKLYIVIDILEEVNRIIEKMGEVEGILMPVDVVSIETLEKDSYYD